MPRIAKRHTNNLLFVEVRYRLKYFTQLLQTMKTITYTTHGTCARYIEVSGENGVITNVKFYGGCNGNLQGISKLVKGMKYEDVIARLKGISCNGKPTSCPDQLCCAIEELMKE